MNLMGKKMTVQRLDLSLFCCTIREGELTEEEKALREYELSYTKAPIASLHNLGKFTFFMRFSPSSSPPM